MPKKKSTKKTAVANQMLPTEQAAGEDLFSSINSLVEDAKNNAST
jgi:hypothetical protein